MTPAEYLKELESALQAYRFRDVRALTDQMDPTRFELPQIRKALGFIRRKRRFADLEHAAGLFHLAGHTAPVIRRQWSQALLDQNRVDQALAILQVASQECADDPVEGPEIRGLIGRAYKQRYVNEGGQENLRSAISAYLPDWEHRKGDYRWAGINVVALVARAKRDGVDPGTALDPAHVASAILSDIDVRGATGVWDYAAAMEAAVALGDESAVLTWLKKYVQHPDSDSFEIASTLRQLKEVWCLKDTAFGPMLLPVLEYALLQREGASLQPLKIDKVRDTAGFEKVWGAESYVLLEWIDSLYRQCDAIVRVCDAVTGKGWGTGFLTAGSSLNPVWGDAPVLLTNSHVISRNPADEAPLRPEEAAAQFTRLPNGPKVRLGELLFSRPRIELDVSVLRIEAPPGSRTLEPYPYLPRVNVDPADPQRIYVIGHPGGDAPLAVSLYDNALAEYEQQYVRYRSPTTGGQSGSPVFTRQLRAFAIHHKALFERQLNEGIVLNWILTAVQRDDP